MRATYRWKPQLNNMNNDNSNITGTDLVTRLVNVLVNEVLLQVNQQINQEMIALSNSQTLLKDRVTALEDKCPNADLAARVRQLEMEIKATPCLEDLELLGTKVTKLQEEVADLPAVADYRDLRQQVDQVNSALEDMDYKVDDLPNEDRVEELVDQKLEDADLTVQVKAALDSLTLEQAEELVRTGLKSLVSKAENINQI